MIKDALILLMHVQKKKYSDKLESIFGDPFSSKPVVNLEDINHLQNLDSNSDNDSDDNNDNDNPSSNSSSSGSGGPENDTGNNNKNNNNNNNNNSGKSEGVTTSANKVKRKKS